MQASTCLRKILYKVRFNNYKVASKHLLANKSCQVFLAKIKVNKVKFRF